MAGNNPKLDFCSQFVHLHGQLIRFGDRPYLAPIYAVTDRNLVLRCSRQTEKSTFLVNSILYEACTRPGVQIVFVCPREQQARVFSHSRLLPAIVQSPLIRRTLLGRKTRKRVMDLEFENGSRVFIRSAYHNADSCRGLSADLLMIDEFQDIAAGDLPILRETLSHALGGGFSLIVGTPKSSENHLEALYSQSTQNAWGFYCEPCQAGVLPTERCLGPRSLVCPMCQTPLNPRIGKWFPRNSAATWGEGFWINHTMVPWLNFDEILERQKYYDLAKLKNEVLGMPSVTGDHVVSRAELEACCGDYPIAKSLADVPRVAHGQLVAGIDWGGGGTSRTVLVIGFMRTDFIFQICRIERFDSQDDPDYVLDQLASRCHQFQVRLITADGAGNGHVQNRLLLERLGPRYPNLHAIIYSMCDHAPAKDGVLMKWTVNRSATIGVLFSRIKRQKILFPRLVDCDSYLDEFACEVAEYDDLSRSVRYTRPETQQDDVLHATNYALLVATKAYQAPAADANY